MTLFIDPLRDDPKAVVDELTYINFKTNRHNYPEITPEGWAKVYGPATANMEARYQREINAMKPRPNVCDDCGGVIGPWLEYQVADPDAEACSCSHRDVLTS